MHALLDSIDRYVDRAGLTREVLPPVRPAAVPTPSVPSRLDLRAEGIRTIVLATGYRPDNDWVDLPITSADGAFRQTRGVTDAPGVYVIGQRFQHRRDSGFIARRPPRRPRHRAPPDRRSGAPRRRPTRGLHQ